MSFSARKIALMGVMIALAIALKLPILSIPNVEFLSFVVFSSGFLLGAAEGLLVGTFVSLIYFTLITPYGLPPPPILAAQIFSMGLIGFSGGLAYRLTSASSSRGPSSRPILFVLTAGTFGLALTLIYDLLTNLGVAVVVGQLWPVMASAVPFAVVHVVSNTVIFSVLSPALIKLSRIGLR